MEGRITEGYSEEPEPGTFEWQVGQIENQDMEIYDFQNTENL